MNLRHMISPRRWAERLELGNMGLMFILHVLLIQSVFMARDAGSGGFGGNTMALN
jgi:hypothetical protein